MTLQETIAEIKRQGGLVYVPHPFDRMHSVPDYEHLLKVLDDVDAIEIFNPRIAIAEFNEEAVRFAAKYHDPRRVPAPTPTCPRGWALCGSGCGPSTDPEEFLQSLRDADIHPQSGERCSTSRRSQVPADQGDAPGGPQGLPRPPRTAGDQVGDRDQHAIHSNRQVEDLRFRMRITAILGRKS